MTKKKKKSGSSLKTSVKTKFRCRDCKYTFYKEYKWELYSAACPKCGKNVFNQPKTKLKDKHIGVIDMTFSPEYFKNKRFMLRDKTWKKDIESRKSLPNGKIGRFRPDGKRYG